jgi:hypothetical protein
LRLGIVGIRHGNYLLLNHEQHLARDGNAIMQIDIPNEVK